MEQKHIQFQKKRDLGLVLSDSFEFLRQEAKPILKVLAIYVLPFLILYAYGQIYFQRNIASQLDLTNQEALMENIGPFYKNLFLFMFFGIFIQSLLAGTFYSYIEAYVKNCKGNFELADIAPRFFANSLLALGAGLIYTIIVFFGMVFCLIPGIIFANSFSLIIFIFIFEKKGISDAMSRSWKLVNLQWWNTFAINIIGILLVFIVGMLLSLPASIAGLTSNVFQPTDLNLEEMPNWYWGLTAASSIISTALYIVPFTFIAFQYFNLAEMDKPKDIVEI